MSSINSRDGSDDMKYRRLGRAGLFVSEIGLGGNTFGKFCDAAQTAAIVHQALDLGITFIDTADSYNGGLSESYIGQALQGRRDEAIICTKTGWDVGEGPNDQGLSYHRIIRRLDQSLDRLGTDYVDVYYMHRPDPFTPMEESLRAMDDLVRAGKVRYVACSNFAGWEIATMAALCDRYGYRMPVISQSLYNILERDIENEVIPACDYYGLSVVPYAPLASGFLTGKYQPDQPVPDNTRGYGNETWQERRLTERNFAAQAVLAEFASQRDHAITEMALAWLLAQDAVCSVIAGATSPEQVGANARAADWEMTISDLTEVDQILTEAGVQ
jgi:aryl-alcohol dehydrogenase-like predicted oxidoreductase